MRRGFCCNTSSPSGATANAAPTARFVIQLWKENDVIQQVREFMRDNWNHPSVALWDASNETHWAFLKDKLIPAVRGLDLSNRPWENGYNLPQGPDDPYEWHPYKFIDYWSQTKPPYFEMSDLEKMTGANESREDGRCDARFDHQRVRLAMASSRWDPHHAGPEGVRTPPGARRDARSAAGGVRVLPGRADRVLAGFARTCRQ